MAADNIRIYEALKMSDKIKKIIVLIPLPLLVL